MNYRRKGPRALGLSLLAVLGLMAFMAGGAQAEWLILHNGETVKFHGTEAVDVTSHEDATLLVVPKNLEILCHETKGEDILITALTLVTGSLVFNKCLAFFNNFKGHLLRAANCDPTNQPIKAGGTGHLILHNGLNWVLFAPKTKGGNFTIVEFGELCALTETSEVTGELVAECGHLSESGFVGLDCSKHQLTQYVRAAKEQALFGAGLFFGENAATIDGVAAAKLAGELYGDKLWGGHV